MSTITWTHNIQISVLEHGLCIGTDEKHEDMEAVFFKNAVFLSE